MQNPTILIADEARPGQAWPIPSMFFEYAVCSVSMYQYGPISCEGCFCFCLRNPPGFQMCACSSAEVCMKWECLFLKLLRHLLQSRTVCQAWLRRPDICRFDAGGHVEMAETFSDQLIHEWLQKGRSSIGRPSIEQLSRQSNQLGPCLLAAAASAYPETRTGYLRHQGLALLAALLKSSQVRLSARCRDSL